MALRIDVGAVFPTTEIGNDPQVIRDWAQTAEGLGYSHVLVYDHVLGGPHENRTPPLQGPYDEGDAFHEPFVLLGYLAGVTTRLGLSTGVIILPQRQTALVAKQAVELDLLSGGRARLGVGTGWNPIEYQALGVPFEDRGPRYDEQIELLRRLWREPLVEFEGRYHRVERAGLLPQPTRDIPIWLGGFSKVAIRRAARVGDGFLFGSTPRHMGRPLELLHAELEANGRPRSACGGEAVIDFSQTPDDWGTEIETWHAAGGTSCVLRAMDTAAEFQGFRRVGFEKPADYIAALETFMKAVS